MECKLSKEAAERARREFQNALDAAAPAYELAKLELFSVDDETFIRKEVERLLYEPQLPNGGEAERRTIKRLKVMSNAAFWKNSEAAASWVADDEKKKSIGWLADKAAAAAKQWACVLPDDPRNAGRYYFQRPLTRRVNGPDYVGFIELLNCAGVCQDWDAKWFAQIMLDGLPEPISNFKLECLFLLRKPDDTVDRLVRLRNVMGETSRGPHPGGSEILEAMPFGAPEKFRTWCLSRGNFAFSGNQTHLQMMHEDICRLSAWRIVNRIDSCGWHYLNHGPVGEKGYPSLKGIWFFDECAIAPGGKILKPDDDGIFWFEGEGFFLNRKGRESEFKQGRPKMRAGITVLNCGIDHIGWTNKPQGETEDDHLRALFRELCQKFYETIGGYDAWLSLGAFFSYAAAPEIFDRYGLFPGLWVHGQMESGKTKVTEWQIAVWGFTLSAGIGIIQSATAVGMLQEAENYSNLPVWMDEFREREIESVKIAILRNAYNRQTQAKWSPDGIQRNIKTAFIVSGESTSSDAAVRSRYPHVQISAARRLANHLEWFTDNKRFFFLLGRFLLERREAFVQQTLFFLDQWLKSPGVAGLNDREKMVHGIDYAAWLALCAMLESHGPEEVAAFKQFTVAHLKSAAEDVTSETNVNIFWQDMITCWKAGAIPKSCFKLKGEPMEHPPQMPDMGHWVSYILYIDPNLTLSAMQVYLTKQRGQVALKRNDLRDQNKTQPYWVPVTWKDADGNIKQLQARFGSGKDSSNMKCWAIKLDLHPLGLQANATRGEYDKFILDDTVGDPRKGALFVIVHGLLEAEGQQT